MTQLRQRLDAIRFHTTSREGLKVPPEHYAVVSHRVLMWSLLENLVLHQQKPKEGATAIPSENEFRPANRVKSIMNFLQIQVEIREERCNEQFMQTSHDIPPQPRHQNESMARNPSDLVLTNESVHHHALNSPPCGSGDHKIPWCQLELSNQDKRLRLKRARCCFKYSKLNQIARVCRLPTNLTCTSCGGDHLTILCDVSRLP